MALYGILSAAVYAGISGMESLRGSQIPTFLVYVAIVLVLYILSVCTTRRSGRGVMAVIFLSAVIFRLILLTSPPTLSDDVYRYVWDGQVQQAGINPYASPPNSPVLDQIDMPWRGKINHPQYTTPYLPVAQAYFRLVTTLSPNNLTAFQVWAVLLDLLGAVFLFLLLKQAGLPINGLTLYLWNPLVVIETAHEAHVDVLMTLLLLAGLWLLVKEHLGWGAALLGLAALVKPLPLLLLPALAWRMGWHRLAVFGLVFTGGMLLYSGAGLINTDGTGVLASTIVFLGGWSFNGVWFTWLQGGLASLFGFDQLLADGGARIILAAAVLLVTVESARRGRQLMKTGAPANMFDSFKPAFLPLGAYLLLSPTLHPWYLLPVLPLAILLEGKRKTLWLGLSAAVILSYLAYTSSARGIVPGWVLCMEGFLVVGWIVWELIQRRSKPHLINR